MTDLGDIDIQKHLHQSSSWATYISKASADEYLTCISDYLNDGLLSCLITATDFSILADKTTDVSDRAELTTFVRYIDSDSNDVKEEFLGLVQIKGNKGAAQISEKISEIFRDKGAELSNMQFNGLDGTNSMSGEITGLQQWLHHLSPHMKYINCWNHWLALVFVHLLKEFKGLQDMDQLLGFSGAQNIVFMVVCDDKQWLKLTSEIREKATKYYLSRLWNNSWLT